jgi:6-phosphogluconate dehydrogenase
VHDLNPDAVAQAVRGGARGAATLEQLVASLAAPRAVWVMVPSGDPTEATVAALAAQLSPGDVIIDGGNSNYHDSERRHATLAAQGIDFVDVGTSGGVWGLAEGYSMMVGGRAEAVARIRPALETLAPAADAGWGHVGPGGAGHFVKMVHNGIEYGIMAAYAEGLNVLENADAGKTKRLDDAETAPLDQPEFYEFDLDIQAIAEVWRRGSVVGSWLLDLTAAALAESPQLSEYSGRVSDSGEGRWTSIAAIEEGVPTPVLTTALHERFYSRDLGDFGDKVLSAMRYQFGGHKERDN